MTETHKRSVAKAISWRVTGTIDTFLISWFITGHLGLAGGIAGTEVMTKIVLFYLHERAWTRTDWGRKPARSDAPGWPPAGLDPVLTMSRAGEPAATFKP